MLSKTDFTFTIGYDGDTALIDGKTRNQCAQLGIKQLCEKSLFRAAFAAALYASIHENSNKDFDEFKAIFNAQSGTTLESIEQFQRLFGVTDEGVSKTLVM